MISKILRYQLITLFVITAAALVAFYFRDSLPDNFLSISSNKENADFLTYYFFSAVAIIGYYTGPWLFLALFIFALAYSFQMSKRNSIWDIFNFFTLLTGLLIFTYLLVPVFLGDGLGFLLKSLASTPILILVGLGCVAAFMVGAFRFNFLGTLTECRDLIEQFLLKRKLSTKSMIFGRWAELLRNKKHELLTETKQKVESFLKREESSTTRPLLLGPTGTEQAAVEEKSSEDNAQIITSESLKQEELPLEYNKENQETTASAKKLPRKKAPDSNDQNYFELVNCLKQSPHPHKVESPDDKYFDLIIARIEEKLNEFKIDGKILNILKGPVVDTFELELGAGVKVSKVTSSQEDLSLALYGAPIRIVYPMKDRHTVGIEVPRNPREIIYL
ncbi:MAG: DNA translocase FtsK, partial [Pseudomonadota bacterium]